MSNCLSNQDSCFHRFPNRVPHCPTTQGSKRRQGSPGEYNVAKMRFCYQLAIRAKAYLNIFRLESCSEKKCPGQPTVVEISTSGT
ncbi:hypothetical protein JTE90_029172 [Oedothorax gibbosus]|uniref:Uncharacterized protein n=1 Tax=Oedothorax gibbosus TaxID=931172 RepID=A0AAV6VGN8_9ARAC|nr:hypothetical protein JTE90_029172 [Oedothorax gibbosus]